jgi:hypothetical protein
MMYAVLSQEGSRMGSEWRQAETALSQIRIKANRRNQLVTVEGHAEGLRCIGIGTDAAVFCYESLPAYAYKIYSKESLHKKEVEEQVYLTLGHHPFFPVYYGKGDRYIVISLERGMTLYDCLLHGVDVPAQAMHDIEEARNYARSKGLNPRDIHLKNVLLQEGRGKLFDVSEYRQPGNDLRWEHLMLAYRYGYRWFRGRKASPRMLEALKGLYKGLYSVASLFTHIKLTLRRLIKPERKVK